MTLIELRTDLGFVFPADASPDIALLADRLQKGPSAGLILIGLSGAAPEALVRLSNDFTAALSDSGRFRFVANGRAGPPGPETAALFDRRYLLNPPVSPGDFDVDGLRASLTQTLRSLATTSGAATKALLPSDPTGRLGQVLASWAGGGGERPGLAGGVWLSRDQSTALIMAQSSAPAFDLNQQQAVVEAVQRTFDGLPGTGEVQLDMTGPSVFAARTSAVIGAEMRSLTLVSAALVIALLYAAFRSATALLAFVLPIGFALSAGALAVQGVFGQMHGVTLAFGGILIGIAVDYQIHLLNHMTAEGDARAAAARIWRTLRLGMLTTVAAFIPMTLSSFPGLAQLGVFAVTGLVIAAFATRWLLPAVLPSRPIPARASSWRWPGPRRGTRLALRLFACLLALAALAEIVVRADGLWEGDLRNLSPIPQSARELDGRLRAEVGAADARYFLVLRGESVEAVLRDSEALEQGLASLVEADAVDGFQLAARYLPSRSSQRRRQGDLPAAETLRANLEAARAGLPFREGLFEPFLETVERSRTAEPLELDDFAKAGLSWLLKPLLFRQGGDWVALVVPRGLRAPDTLAAFAAASRDPAVTFIDLKSGSEGVVAGYRREAMNWLLLGAVLGLGILFAGLRSPVRVGGVAAPVALAVLLTVGLLSVVGTALSLFHLISLLLVAGVGLDYALFFDRHAAGSDDWQAILRGNLLCAATSVAVFSVLAFSEIPVLHGIGMTVAVGTILSISLTFVFARQRDDIAR